MPSGVDAAQLAQAFAGPGTESVECEGETTRGFVDRQGALMPDGMGGQQAVGRASAVIVTGSLSQVAQGKRVTVNGVEEYEVREVLPEDDGAMQRIILV